MPFHARGHARTKLCEDCAAIIGWYETIVIPDDVRFWGGDVPADVMIDLNGAIRTDIAKRLGREFTDLIEAMSLLQLRGRDSRIGFIVELG